MRNLSDPEYLAKLIKASGVANPRVVVIDQGFFFYADSRVFVDNTPQPTMKVTLDPPKPVPAKKPREARSTQSQAPEKRGDPKRRRHSSERQRARASKASRREEVTRSGEGSKRWLLLLRILSRKRAGAGKKLSRNWTVSLSSD